MSCFKILLRFKSSSTTTLNPISDLNPTNIASKMDSTDAAIGTGQNSPTPSPAEPSAKNTAEAEDSLSSVSTSTLGLSSNKPAETLKGQGTLAKEDIIANMDSKEMAPTPTAVHPAETLSELRKVTIVIFLSLWAFCSTMTIAIISPALPYVQKDLDTSQQAVNSSVSVATFVSGLAPLFWAALSDARGRKFVYLVTGPIMIVASICGYWTPNIAVFYVIRIVQQAAGSAVVSTASGSIADIFPRERLAGQLANMYLGMSAGPTVGPLIGGLITQSLGWRWTFIFSGIFAFVIWTCVALIVPETLKKKPPPPPGTKVDNVIVKAFKSLLYNRYPFVFFIVSLS